MKFFDLDSPLMQVLNKVADLLWLNILTLICCIPIVTAGASLTAMNYMALKIVRNEECYITKGFFKSFKQNFKQVQYRNQGSDRYCSFDSDLYLDVCIPGAGKV